jgi:thiopeptide-type bacteriocin biosynthesis protein
MKTCSHIESQRRAALAESISQALSRFYVDQSENIHLGYVTERAIDAIESSIEEQKSTEHWIYFRIAAQLSNRPQMIAFEIAECIQESCSAIPIVQWWWLNKWDASGPAVRLRVQVPFERLEAARHELSCRFRQRGFDFSLLCYEPELRLFGGAEGMRIAHELFAHDSSFLVQWIRQSDQKNAPVIPPGLSLALALDLGRASGLDLFELWDLFDRISGKRTAIDDSLSLKCRELAARIIAAEPEAVFAVYEGVRRQLISEYRARLRECAERLSRAYFQGKLECGLRESLVPIVLFHWNRILLPFNAQAALSLAAANELARLSHQGTK